MPEGHSVHRIAREFDRNIVGREVAASSPQGRFAEGAAILNGRTVTQARAVGKQMFVEFDDEIWLRVHLGIYGAWDFAGELVIDPSGERAPNSIGAPRRSRVHVRMSEQTQGLGDVADEWPPPVVGQVRLRLLTELACADLRGPTACELQTPDEVAARIAKLGPDPLVGDSAAGEERFVAVVRRGPAPIGLQLMDQSVVSGIGNVYRAELLFRAGLNPHTPGRDVSEEVLRAIWRDWAWLLAIGVETGQMMTMDDLDADSYRRALAHRDDRHWVYHRAGAPCRVCGTAIVMEEMGARKLYWCPRCQA
ncbi:DNA-formamidopyrimidine glycosylase family protein [Microbacterium sp.]|uniref:Fpg/Nei family DNA glycosylase n=1 Tax=Microbacterium sp. TaxID=51671 RepID=UPI0025DA978A|nr:DNA-formamidopyrimidine glycosylase family protein [Microbacterium sp.]